uniref:ATP synthase complex subunit 8 n=1 Tax=Semanotus bifasciatus TaxID=2020315 RepID=A0A343ESN0_9CUCU|nr:ATP synthase F0 subunit 8 [Semanotus bifasciatus]
MPQMAPLNWLTLFIYFSLVMLMFNSINYYSFLYEIKSKTSKEKKMSYNWKW